MNFLKNLFSKQQKPTLKEDIITSKKWISAALNSSNYKADFSLNSLKEIDRFFDEQNIPGGLLSEKQGERLFAIGAYIGEVVIANYGGEWITDDKDPQGEVNIAVKLTNGNIIWPVQKAIKRLQNGNEENIYNYVFVLGKAD